MSRRLETLIPFSNPNAYYDGQPLGMGVVKIVTCAAGASVPLNHKLGRKPNHVEVLANGAAYKGDSYISVQTDANNCTCVFQNALSGAAVWLV